jgi:catechol 2,3-dioxygenase-like lactoylglutathione lyase family enzyme
MTTEVQEKNSAVDFATTTRVHVAINATNIERSLPFYKVLFGQEPTKVRPGYAKFEVAEPPVNFTLNENANFTPGGSLSHFGIQVKSTSEVTAAKSRFIESGLATFEEDQVSCCYAVQDKVWVTDPDGNSWEVFVVTEADAPTHAPVNKDGEAGACCTPSTSAGLAEGKKTISLVASNGGSCC